MIEVNKTYGIQRYRYGWELHTRTTSTEDNMVAGRLIEAGSVSSKTTFHSSMKQLAGRLIDIHIEECESMEELVALLNKAEDIIVERMK